MAEETPALSIGTILGDSDLQSRAWDDAIRVIKKRVIAAREGISSPLNVNVVYHVDGRIVPNAFTGVRTGSYVGRENLLVVQAAAHGGPVVDTGLLDELLVRAIDEAERYARRKKLAENLDPLRELVATVVRS